MIANSLKTNQLHLQGVKLSSPQCNAVCNNSKHVRNQKTEEEKKRGHLKVGLKSNVATSNLPVLHSNSMSEKRNLRRTQRFVWNIKKKLKRVSFEISVNLQHFFSHLSGSRSEADDSPRTLPFGKSVHLQNLWPGKCDFIFISILYIREKFSIFFFPFLCFSGTATSIVGLLYCVFCKSNWKCRHKEGAR